MDADAVAANVGTEAVTIARVPTQQGGHTTEAGTAAGAGVGAPPPLSCGFNDCTNNPYPASYPSNNQPRTGDIAQELWESHYQTERPPQR